MGKRTINIDPMKDKAQYDITLSRSADDLTWVAYGATNVVITFLPPYENESPSSRTKSNSRSFSKSKHGPVAPYDKATHGEGQIEYLIEVTYPSGTLIIDPFVKILP